MVADSDAAKLEPPRAKVPLIVPVTVAGAFFMDGLDSSIISTSLPQMAESFAVSPPQMSAAITSYLISLAIFIPVSGWVADRFGARTVFCSAIAIFTLGSVLCGLSETLPQLVLSRILQGFGGAMMTPVGRLILARVFPKDQLMKAMSYYMLPGMLGPTMGPLVGGFVYDLNPARPPMVSMGVLFLMWLVALGLIQPEKPTGPAPAMAGRAA